MSTNGLDFRKQYNSDGEIRYTYMPYLEDSFADGDCSGINPGCVVVMDENYEVIDEIYYLDENGDEMLIDPHGFTVRCTEGIFHVLHQPRPFSGRNAFATAIRKRCTFNDGVGECSRPKGMA